MAQIRHEMVAFGLHVPDIDEDQEPIAFVVPRRPDEGEAQPFPVALGRRVAAPILRRA